MPFERPLAVNVAAGASGAPAFVHPPAGHVPPLGAAYWRCTVCVATPEPASPNVVSENETFPSPLYCGTPEKPPPVGADASATTVNGAPAALVRPALSCTVADALPPWSAVGDEAVYV